MGRGLVALALAVGVLTVAPRDARAGCPGTCQIAVGALASTPALPACAAITLMGQTCDCGVFVDLTAHCSGQPLTSGTCTAFTASSGDAGVACGVVGGATSFELRAMGNGDHHWALDVSDGTTTYALSIDATVTDYDSGSGCDVVPRRPGAGELAIGLLATALAFVMASRRSRC